MFKHTSGSWDNSTGFQERFLGQNIIKNIEVTFFDIISDL